MHVFEYILSRILEIFRQPTNQAIFQGSIEDVITPATVSPKL